jgi:hypothetical protein
MADFAARFAPVCSDGENFLYVYQGRAERAGPGLAVDLGKRRAMDTLTPKRRSSRPSTGQAFRGNVARLGAACRS